LNDGGATFAGPAAAPIRVTGIADGTTEFDAVNYRQLRALEKLMSQGIASTAAMANVPQVDQDKTFSVGIGVGGFNSQSAFAVGASYRFLPNAVLKGSLGTSNSGKTAIGVGASMSW
jgi:autotransporter adhesin